MIPNNRPWVTQPQFACGINWTHPSTSRLELAINPGAGFHPVDLARGRPITYAANLSIAYDGNTPGTSGTQVLRGNPVASILVPANSEGLTIPSWSNSTNEGSLLILQKPPNATNEWLEIGAGSQGDHFPFGSGVYSDAFWSSRWLNGASPPIGLYMNDPVAAGISVKAGSQRFLWNGSLNTSATNASSFTLPPTIRFGSSGGVTGFNGHIFAIFAWSRALSDQEILNLSLNPWQLFKSLRINRPIGGAAIIKPTLTAASVFNLAATSAQARVTFTRP